MEHFKRAIIDYIQLPKTEYAIQINGKWGAGKTFFVKNNLISEIKELSRRKDESYKVYYISLNGVARVDEIGESVFFEMAGAKDKFNVQSMKMIATYGPTLATFLGPFQGISEKVINNSTEDILTNIKKFEKNDKEEVVLFVDDLERISKKISISEVLGYIYTNYIENNAAKVIFITNENEIEETDDYNKIKEKIIGRDLFFEQTSFTAIEQIILEAFKEDEDLTNFIRRNEKNLFDVINVVFLNLNLRTVRFAFDNFSIVFNHTKEFVKNPNHFSYVMKVLLLNVLIVSREYKEGEIRKREDLSFVYGHQIYYKRIIKESGGKSREFVEKYFEKNRFIDNYSHFFESITGMIIDGYLDDKKFNKEISEFLEIKRRNIHSNFELEPIQIITNFKYYTEDRVREAQKDIKTLITNNKVMANEYPQLYQELLNIKELNLYFLDDDIKEMFRIGFYRALENWPLENEEIIEKNISVQDELIQEMIKELQRKKRIYLESLSKKNIVEWLEKIVEDESDEELFSKVEKEMHLFKLLSEIQVIENYIIKDRRVPIRLVTMFYHKYLKRKEDELSFTDESKYLIQIIEQLEIIYDKHKIDKIHAYNIKVLVREMEKIRSKHKPLDTIFTSK